MARLAEQERARKAHEAVVKWRGYAKPTEYRQELQQLPSRILAAGLGQTLAFYAAKGGPDGDGVEADIGGELAKMLIGKPRCVDLLDHLMRCDAAEYRRLTREALAYAEWLKRYAAALIPKPEAAGSGGAS